MNYSTPSIESNFDINVSLSFGTIFVCLLGLCLNIFLLIVISKSGFGRRITYRLITIATIADIITDIMLTANYTLNVIRDFEAETGRWLCRIIIFTISMSYAISIFNLCLLAIGHYLRVTRITLHCFRFCKGYYIIICEILIFLMAFSISFPMFTFIDVYRQEPKFCDIPYIDQKISIYLTAYSTILYFIPSLLLMLIYFKIVRYVGRYIQPIDVASVSRKENRRRKLMKVLTIITVSDVIITLPFFIAIMIIAISKLSQRQIRQLNSTYFALLFFSFTTTAAISIVNPILLLWLDRDVNTASKAIITKSFYRRRNRSQMTNLFNYQQPRHPVLMVNTNIHLTHN